MALETWSGPGKPQGNGWQITGYSQRRIPMNPNRMGSGFRTERIPIYSRMAPQAAPQPTQQRAKSMSDYRYTDPGDKGFFGMKDFDELSSQGASIDIIRQFANRAQYGIGPKAAQRLNAQPYTVTNPEAEARLTGSYRTQEPAYTPPPPPAPEPLPAPPTPAPLMTIGGPSSSLDSGATGFRRKRSSARMAGLTSKGTSQLKITGQSARSSGLNIG